MGEPLSSSSPSLPVATFTALGAVRRREIADVDDHVLAALVRLRLQLERHHGWWLLGGVVGALASVVLVGAVVDSRLAFGAYAAAVASGTVGLGVFVSWLQAQQFRRAAQLAGLSSTATERLFVVAADADHWLQVIERCGLTVSANDIAAFIRQR